MSVSTIRVFLFAAVLSILAALVIVLLWSMPDRRALAPTDDGRLDRLLTIPYLCYSREEDEEEKQRLRNVVVYEKGKAYDGYNLYPSRMSDEIFLIDMEGDVVHQWTSPQESEGTVEYAACCHNGDLLVINKFQDVVRIDLDSQVIWRKRIPVHHDLSLKPDGSSYIVGREIKRLNQLQVRFPAVWHVDSDGRTLNMWSTFECIDEIREKFNVAPINAVIRASVDPLVYCRRCLVRIYRKISRQEQKLYDPFHQNTVTILPQTELGEEDSRFREGNLLVCYREIDQIAIFDPEAGEFVWVWGDGVLDKPHYPTMLENGNILIFDNGPAREYSRVIEVDPTTGEIEWEYTADPREAFYSETGGAAQPLPNGNTLITETTRGRVFEINREGEIVWEWHHPVFKDGQRSCIYRMTRYPRDQIEGFLADHSR